MEIDTSLAPAGRFAPTPSGRMHLGNLYAALLAWLSARNRGMRFILRIEDLDVRASKPEFIPQMEDDLHWLGIDWDEGGLEGGPCAPYLQHERFGQYGLAFDELRCGCRVYPCFCSRAQLHVASAPHASDGQVVYPGTCKGLTTEQVLERSRSKRPAWRIEVPHVAIAVDDECQGHYSQELDTETGDFILRRADGLFAYQLAVVVDDALMGVAEVVRGRDLLSSTPRQILLQRLLGFPQPRYAHIPMLVAPDGRRLAKRNHGSDAGVIRRRYSAEQVVGWLAYVSGLQDSPEPRDATSLVEDFSWDRIRKEDVVVDDAFL